MELKKLLFVDDSPDILATNGKYFSRQGYEVATLDRPLEAVDKVKAFRPDCIILDVEMPGLNGFDLCNQIRAVSTAPVIFLSGRGEEENKIEGLMRGANDYLLKPYSLKELAARIQVQLRIAGAQEESVMILRPPLKLDLLAHKAYHNDEEILLSAKEYQLLYLLVTAEGKTLSFEEIGTELWGSYTENDRRTIMVTTSRLRRKLEDYPLLENMIETVWSKGYRFVLRRIEQ